MENNKFFGGVEGGATHSNLVICDAAGQVVGRAKGPGTNHWTLGIEECVTRILAMLERAKDDAGLTREVPLDCLGLTLSGCEQDSTNATLATRVRERDSTCARAVYVASDTAGSLVTGAPGGGMVVIAGTGSNALLRTAEGRQYGCGGWGYLLGDEGGAYWIAHRAVKTIFDAEDGLQPSPHCTERVWGAVKEHFEADSRMDLLPHAYSHFDKSKFAGLTAKLSHLAQSGDPLSLRLFADAGRALGSHIAALCRHTTVKKMRVVCVGSVWHSWDVMKPGLLQELREKNIKTELEFVRLRVSSAMGAAWLAAQHVGYDLPRDDSQYCEVFYTYHPLAHGDVNTNITNTNDTNGKITVTNDGVVNGVINDTNGKVTVNNDVVVNGKLKVNGKIEIEIDNGEGVCTNNNGNGDWCNES